MRRCARMYTCLLMLLVAWMVPVNIVKADSSIAGEYTTYDEEHSLAWSELDITMYEEPMGEYVGSINGNSVSGQLGSGMIENGQITQIDESTYQYTEPGCGTLTIAIQGSIMSVTEEGSFGGIGVTFAGEYEKKVMDYSISGTFETGSSTIVISEYADASFEHAGSLTGDSYYEYTYDENGTSMVGVNTGILDGSLECVGTNLYRYSDDTGDAVIRFLDENTLQVTEIVQHGGSGVTFNGTYSRRDTKEETQENVEQTAAIEEVVETTEAVTEEQTTISTTQETSTQSKTKKDNVPKTGVREMDLGIMALGVLAAIGVYCLIQRKKIEE